MSDTPPSLVPVAEPADDGKVNCQYCSGRYFPGPGMGVHVNSAHPEHKPRGKRKHTSTRPPSNHGPGRPPKIDLTVDDIFDVVVSQMFPRGTIPITALTPLLRWRHATDQMLDEVLHGSNGKQ